MTGAWQILFGDMQRDIHRCLSLALPETEKVESCFWIAMHYWEEIQKKVAASGFASAEAEISFYKVTKPRFASYIEYFSLVSEGLNFVPPCLPCPEELTGVITEAAWQAEWRDSVREYWRREGERGQRFFNKHQAVLDYYLRGETGLDADYFLARRMSVLDTSPRRSHNRDSPFFTVQEEIITSYLAYSLYAAYIQGKISEAAAGGTTGTQGAGTINH